MKKTILTILIIITMCAIVCVSVVAITQKQTANSTHNGSTENPETMITTEAPDTEAVIDTTVENPHDDSNEDFNDDFNDDSNEDMDLEAPIAAATETTNEGDQEATTEFPDCFDLELEHIFQYPELPAGCESVSLTMILNYLNYNLSKTDIADDYLVYSDNFVMGYCGDPFSAYTGGGIYAPGMTITANNFLSANGSKHIAENITGTDFHLLLEYVAQGHPILIWTTIKMVDCSKGYYSYDEEGNSYAWDYNEHCVVLTGYDFKAGTVTVYDPIDGIIYRDMEAFKTIYEEMDEMAIIIKELN